MGNSLKQQIADADAKRAGAISEKLDAFIADLEAERAEVLGGELAGPVDQLLKILRHNRKTVLPAVQAELKG